MSYRHDARPATGIMFAFVCLFLLGAMPIISNGRPPGWAALTFALWLSIWQLAFSLPRLIWEWRMGERGILSHRLPRPERRRVLAVALFTGALFGLSTWLYVLSIEKAGAVNAAIALQAYPLFAAALEAMFLGVRKSFAEWGFTLLIIVALYYLATQGTWRPEGFSAWFLLALAVPVLWSIAHIILRQALVTTPITPNQVTTSRLAVSTAMLLPLALVLEGPQAVAAGAGSPGFQISAIAMGLAYYLELIFWFSAIRHIDVSLASTITVPAPVVTMIFAVTILGEGVRGIQVVALGVVILGLFGMLHVSARRRTEALRAS